ncbi:zinc finger protein CONSTANS-LIKE 9 isoform X2 [Euphorbia lathyris]|uniref:zinc finger protein CONSTANS-LIKE 9 isoform X2 n=1 Tax=Euphorbia lathyris TaxID=212925 RepID=UPI003313A86C
MIFMIPKGNNKMDKICEFCAALKPVVYCKADAAFLCLSCDAKVHSANSLSNRHLRTLLCDSCRNHPAYARCLDHRMFVCSTCDHSIHVRSSPHQKRILSSYTGCPSAKDFAALWGFAFDEFDKIAGQLQLFSAPRTTSAQPSKATFEFPIETHLSIGSTSRTSKLNYSTLVSGAQTEEGFGSKQTEKLYKGQKQQNIGFILQQILDLKKLQLTEVDNSSSPLMSSLEETDVSSSVFKNSKKYDDSVNHAQQDPDNAECLLRDSLPLSFAQSEDSPLPTTAANPLVGESFCDQLWSQNMQDLGVCEDILCHDDFNIPDVDITFRNFEELFGTEQDPIRGLLDEKNASFSSVEKDMSLDTSHNRNAGKRVDPSVASAVYVSQPVCMNEDTSPSNQTFAFPGSLDYHQTIEPSYSTMSFSMSRFSADGGGIGCLDSGLSPFITGAEGSYHSSDLEGLHSEAKDVTMKRKEKQTWYAPRKAGIDVRKRVKGRLAKTEEYDSDSIDITRSY